MNRIECKVPTTILKEIDSICEKRCFTRAEFLRKCIDVFLNPKTYVNNDVIGREYASATDDWKNYNGKTYNQIMTEELKEAIDIIQSLWLDKKLETDKLSVKICTFPSLHDCCIANKKFSNKNLN